jgi:hypothetical protein
MAHLMPDAHALFLSLPTSAQIDIWAAALQGTTIDMRKLTRAVYPYVQTLADARDIAYYLASEAEHYVDDLQTIHQTEPAVSLTNVLVRFMYGALHPED